MSSQSAHTLVLLRHAKAEPASVGMSDLQRPLAQRGVADAREAGRWLAANNLVPDLVLCSSARRTRQTWAAVRDGLGLEEGAKRADVPVALVPQLYTKGVDAAIDLIAEMDDEIGILLVVGHNPTVSVVSAVLDPGGGWENGLRTASLAVHSAPSSWADCERGSCPLMSAYTARGVQ